MNTRLLLKHIQSTLSRRRLTLSVSESCTGGMLCSMITDRPGSSAFFSGGIVAYSDAVKHRIVGVKSSTLKIHGAVSAQTAKEMARNVRAIIKTDIGVGITGIAGPGGATLKKPLGLVYIAVATAKRVSVYEFRFKGGRAAIRKKVCRNALCLIQEQVAG